MKNISLSILIIFSILSLVKTVKLNKYKNQKVINIIPVKTLKTASPYHCLAMYTKYCVSSLMSGGLKACEIIKLYNGYECNYYGSLFSTSLLINSSVSNVYVRQKGII